MKERRSVLRLRLWCSVTALLVVGLAFLPLHALAQEHFGEFLDKLKGIFLVETKPRPAFKLDGAFRFMDPNGLLWTVPSETQVDGASIPQLFWSLIGGPFEGPYINASVIHDYYCEKKERTAHDTHRNFYYGMRASGVSEWKAILMHWAVSTFGPSWRLERRVAIQHNCGQIRWAFHDMHVSPGI